MTGPLHPSDRPSDRVDVDLAASPDSRAPDAAMGAETMASAGVSPTATPERSRRITDRRLDALLRDLSDRDQAIIRDVDSFRFLTSHQIQQLHFAAHDTPAAAARACRRVTQRLARYRLIEPLERRIGGVRAGSAGFVWRLGLAADRWRRETVPGVRARRREPSVLYLEHTLGVADCYVAAVTLARSGGPELLDASPEPHNWRSFMSGGGAPRILKPDLALTTASGEYEDRWFIEFDRGTESLPTVIGQCLLYEQYRRTGQEQAAAGLFPLVAWVTLTEARASQISAAIQRNRNLDPRLYRVTTTANFTSLLTTGGAL